MTTTYFIAGILFFASYLLYTFVKWKSGRNKKYEEAERDLRESIDDHNTDKFFDAIRRMRKNK